MVRVRAVLFFGTGGRALSFIDLVLKEQCPLKVQKAAAI
jgi:hypothetical protein